jgi:dipeptidyl aminopeptidase/acylaminoacyl peptidase
MKQNKNLVVAVALVMGTCIVPFAQQKRPIIPADCVTVRYLQTSDGGESSPISMSPDEKRVAYTVKSPNLRTNENDIELYVKTISVEIASSERPVMVGDISRFQWLGDSRSIMVLGKVRGRQVIQMLDIATGKAETLVRFDKDIDEFVADNDGHIIVFSVTTSADEMKPRISERDIASGYRIPFQGLAQTAWPQKEVFVTRRLRNKWTTPALIRIESPFSHQRLSVLMALSRSLGLSLSPNGDQLLLQYDDLASSLPQRWRDSPFNRYVDRLHTVPGHRVLVLYNLKDETTTVPLETPFTASVPLWSSDSQSFAVFAKPPVGSEWEKSEAASLVEHGNTAQLFWVQPDQRRVELIATHEQAPYPYGPPLNWGKDDSLLVGALDGTVTRFSHSNGHWDEGQSVKLPIDGYGYLVSDGIHLIGDIQSARVPPTLFITRIDNPKVEILAKLNPQFDDLVFASVKDVNWKTSVGKSVAGTLFLPPDYKEGAQYPLVIQTKPYGGRWFACDYGPGHFPSFIPEPLADAGIAYLGFYFPDEHDGKNLEDYYSKGYPGDIAEAAFNADVYDTAVEALSERGLIDKNKVGIIGFSHSGWYTEFALVHGNTKYRAASVADNVEYSFTEHAMGALVGFDSKLVDTMYGGPPYGNTLKNWTDYSVSFNVDRIHSPLLIETMGKGALFDRRNSPPFGVSHPFELFTGLNLLHKPVEFYYYPNEDHQPDDPQARLANLQRNLDWYRFWLQGYERPNPEDPDQYKRWEHLRDLQDAEDKSGSQPTAAKPN